MKHFTPTITAAILMIALFTIAAGSLDAGERQPEGSVAAMDQLDAARAKLQVAERICHMFHDAESGATRGGMDPEAIFRWSKRQMQAEMELYELDPSLGNQEDAILRHVEWMKAWNQRVVESNASSPFGIAVTEYFVAEAEAIHLSTTTP